MSREEEVAISEALDKRTRYEAIMGESEYAYVRQVFHFLLATGFRFSEMFAFTVDGDYADLRNGTTKSNQGRRVPLTRRAKAAAEYILTSPHHQALRRLPGKKPWDWVAHRWQTITKAAGCPDISLHILRHTCASRMVQRGVAATSFRNDSGTRR